MEQKMQLNKTWKQKQVLKTKTSSDLVKRKG